MKRYKDALQLPDDMDPLCIDLCNTLNTLQDTNTCESCSGHGKHEYWIFFKCYNLHVLTRLGRVVDKRYSDGNWEIVVDSCDGEPFGRFWLRTKTILPEEQLKESIKGLIENIDYWFNDEFDDYFEANAWDSQIKNMVKSIMMISERITSGNASHLAGLIRSYGRIILSKLTGKSEEYLDEHYQDV